MKINKKSAERERDVDTEQDKKKTKEEKSQKEIRKLKMAAEKYTNREEKET